MQTGPESEFNYFIKFCNNYVNGQKIPAILDGWVEINLILDAHQRSNLFQLNHKERQLFLNTWNSKKTNIIYGLIL